VSGHIDQNVAPIISQESFTPRHIFSNAVRQQTDEVLHRDLIAPIINFNIIAVQIQSAISIVIDSSWEGIAWVTRHVIGQHQNNLRIGDAETLNGTVERKDIGKVAVIEPEARGGDQDGPVGSVLGGCENYEGNGEEEDCAE